MDIVTKAQQLLQDAAYFTALSPSDKPNNIMLLLHGYGSNGHDLISLAPMMATSLSDYLFVSPNAVGASPLFPLNAYQWFSLDDQLNYNYAEIDIALKVIEAMIDHLCHIYNCDKSHITIAGFSQGGFMSLMSAFYRIKGLKRAICMGGWFDPNMAGEYVFDAYCPAIMLHGENDDVVKLEWTQQSYEYAQEQGANIALKTFAHLSHSIDERVVNSVIEFIENNQ